MLMQKGKEQEFKFRSFTGRLSSDSMAMKGLPDSSAGWLVGCFFFFCFFLRPLSEWEKRCLLVSVAFDLPPVSVAPGVRFLYVCVFVLFCFVLFVCFYFKPRSVAGGLDKYIS